MWRTCLQVESTFVTNRVLSLAADENSMAVCEYCETTFIAFQLTVSVLLVQQEVVSEWVSE